MKSLPAFLLILVLGAPAVAAASPINTYDTVMFSLGHVFIPFASDVERTEVRYRALEALWEEQGEPDRIDDYDQPWKFVPVSGLESILGPVSKHYLVINPAFGEMTGEEGRPCVGAPDAYPDEWCLRALKSLDFHQYEVRGAALVRWACAGGLKAVLDLGPVREDHGLREWNAVVLGSDEPLEVAAVENRKPKEETPTEILETFDYRTFSFDGRLLRFSNGYRIGLDHTFGRTGVHRFLVVDFGSDEEKAKSVEPLPPFHGC